MLHAFHKPNTTSTVACSPLFVTNDNVCLRLRESTIATIYVGSVNLLHGKTVFYIWS